MSQQTGAYPPTASGGPAEPPRTQVARDEANELGRTTAQAGQHVAGVASEQASAVAGEARRQAKDLFEEARGQATEQARAGQQRAAQGLHDVAGELHRMAEGAGDERGPASDLAAQAAGRVEDLAGWLDRHEPGDLLEEVRSYARRRPGTFLVAAAAVGVLAGRLTRGVVDARDDSDDQPTGAAPATDPNLTPYPPATYPAGPGPAAAPGHPGPQAPPYGAPVPPPLPTGLPPQGGPGGMPMPPPMPPQRGGPGGPPMPPPQGGPGGLPPLPPQAYPPASGDSGATTVGEYVEEVERGGTQPRHEYRADPQDRP